MVKVVGLSYQYVLYVWERLFSKSQAITFGMEVTSPEVTQKLLYNSVLYQDCSVAAPQQVCSGPHLLQTPGLSGEEQSFPASVMSTLKHVD